jgi:uncharacterized protein (TIGR00251 family)
MLDIREADGGVTLRLRVQPRASREELVGERGGALLVRLTAPPIDGQANAALVRFLARRLGRPASALRLVHGTGAREKVLRVEGVTAAGVRSRLELPAPDGRT